MSYGHPPPGYGPSPYPYPQGPPPKPPISGTDLSISIVALILTVIGLAGSAFLGLMMLAFTDHCPPATCHIDIAVTAILTGLGIAALVGVAGITWTIVHLVRRTRAWPVALATLGLCAAACLFGFVGYIQAVGG